MFNLIHAHLYSKKVSANFFNRYQNLLSKTRIGCSFNPEHWMFDNEPPEIILKSAKILVEDLEITDIRLSIRWSKVYIDGKINLSYYEELFKYFFSQNVNICLNVGPIKTMRWPEETVSEQVLKDLEKVPAKETVMTSESELGKLSLEYLQELLETLKKVFPPEQLDKIRTIQGNNEGFNKFGQFGWTMSDEFEMKVFEIIHNEFPDKNLMINSAGRNDLKKVMKLVNRLNEETKMDYSKFIVGYNYYYKVPRQSNNFILKYFDNLILAFPGSMRASRLKRLSSKLGFEIEISELQGEPWLGVIPTPGNSVQEFRYTLIRCITEILNYNSYSGINNKPKIIRFWGIEDLLMKILNNQITDEHRGIIEIILKMNEGQLSSS